MMKAILRRTIRKKVVITVIIFVIFFATVFFLFPIVWLFLTSFKQRRDAFSIPPSWIFLPTLDNFKYIFVTQRYSHFLLNSLVVVIFSTLISLTLGSLAAYGLARFKIPGARNIAFWILSMRMLPPIAVIIPFFLMMRRFGFLDTRASLIILYPVFNFPISVWMMRVFFMEIPVELEESAMVDGCSRMGAFGRITLRLAAPGLAATAILCFIMSWNEFMFALILTGLRSRTLPVATIGLQTDRAILWGPLCAAALIIMLPVVVFVLSTQRHLVRGLTFGVVKG